MKGGYEVLSWINDADGRHYVCALENIGNKKSFDDLTDEEKSYCAEVNQLFGTKTVLGKNAKWSANEPGTIQ